MTKDSTLEVLNIGFAFIFFAEFFIIVITFLGKLLTSDAHFSTVFSYTVNSVHCKNVLILYSSSAHETVNIVRLFGH